VSQYGLRAEDARLLCGERTLADYFESVVRESKSPATIVSNWVAGEFLRYLGERAAGLDDVPIPARDLAELIDMVTDQQITSNTGKAVLAEMFKAGGSAAAIVKEKGLDQVSDEAYLQKLITRILDENPKEVAQYLAGKETILQWLMGQVARATQGKADPQIARDLLTKALALKKEK
jgi:aspartyl-tRNA(Asn)/glutamyl-tRNA(Gln) amidotransferase subunit B